MIGAVLQVCLNGPRSRLDHPGLPVSPAELAVHAAAAVAAGARDIHLHPKDDAGRDTLDARAVAAAVEAVRAAVPSDVLIGVTTGAWTAPDPRHRAALVQEWTTLPDHASVNWHEDGADIVAQALLERGVQIEAGIYSGTDAARRFRSSPLSRRVLRVLAEVTDTNADTAPDTALALLSELGHDLAAPVLLHGEDAGAWPVLRVAARLGISTRIGLEDVLVLPNGSPADDNAQLVEAAHAILVAGGA
jgi:uncharacterized protein (DUF849 family)